MIHLIKKDIRLNRLVLLIFLLADLVIIPVILEERAAALVFGALFIQVILCHVLFTMNRQNARGAKENRLLIALPVNRRNIVLGKYLFCLLCVLANAAWLCLITLTVSLLGGPMLMPVLVQFLMMVAIGIVYFIFMLPISYAAPQYASVVALVVYLAVIVLPSKLPEWLGNEADFSQMMMGFAVKLGGFVLPVIVVFIILFSLASLRISQSAYQRAEF